MWRLQVLKKWMLVMQTMWIHFLYLVRKKWKKLKNQLH